MIWLHKNGLRGRRERRKLIRTFEGKPEIFKKTTAKMPDTTTERKKKSRPKRNEALLPAWWMEVTPHHTLDLEDEQSRREMEERMAMYYAQLAEQEASKGMMFDIDGNPIDPNSVITPAPSSSGDWKSNWTGRPSKKDSAPPPEPEKPKMFGGRNFKPGSPGWDPKQWGIDANDPDYDKYLSGSMLPPQFVTAMNNFAKATGHYQAPSTSDDMGLNMRTSEGAYGRLAEQQAHIPDWMKKKLRSTTQGHSIRQGTYDDSPNRHWKNKDGNAIEEGDEEGGGREEPEQQQPQEPQPEEPEQQPRQEPPEQRPEEAPTTKNKSFASPSPPSSRFNHAPPKQYQHKDYYYNATNATVSNNSNQKPFMDPDAAENDVEGTDDEDEIVDKSQQVGNRRASYRKPSNSAAVVTPAQKDDESNLNELQAKLAAKMAELERLQTEK